MDYSYLVKKKFGDVILRTILLKLKNKDVIEKSLCSSRYINLDSHDKILKFDLLTFAHPICG